MLTQFLLAAAVVAFCSCVQAAVGFSYSLFAIPLLLWIGFSLPEAVALAIVTSAFQQVYAVACLRRSVEWKLLPLPLLAGVLGLPLGVLALRHLAGQASDTVRFWIGVLVLAVLLLRWLLQVPPRDRVAPAWGAVAGFCSGVLAGLASIGGPPIVLWIHSHRWPGDRLRGTMLAFFLALLPFQLAIFMVAFGREVASQIGLGVLLLPVTTAGAWLGLRLGAWMPDATLRRVAYALLVFLAATLIF